MSSSDRLALVSEDDGSHSLKISTVTKADEGEYKFTIESDSGSAWTAAKLIIEGEILEIFNKIPKKMFETLLSAQTGAYDSSL